MHSLSYPFLAEIAHLRGTYSSQQKTFHRCHSPGAYALYEKLKCVLEDPFRKQNPCNDRILHLCEPCRILCKCHITFITLIFSTLCQDFFRNGKNTLPKLLLFNTFECRFCPSIYVKKYDMNT